MKAMQKLTGIYQVLVGTGILGIWTLLGLKREIPEFDTAPWQITMHISAEVITGILLFLSGLYVLVRGRKPPIFYLSMGALIYTLVASPGYYAHQAQWGIAALFLALLLTSILILIFQKDDT
jgi:hypothetical protein